MRRMSESIQADPRLLTALEAAGALPGIPVRAVAAGRTVLLGSCLLYTSRCV